MSFLEKSTAALRIVHSSETFQESLQSNLQNRQRKYKLLGNMFCIEFAYEL